MPSIAMRILVIGEFLPGTGEILRRLSGRGWGARKVPTLRDARAPAGDVRFRCGARFRSPPRWPRLRCRRIRCLHSRTLMVGVALSESCLWLPVVDRGKHVLGKRALNVEALESEMETLLTSQAYVAASDAVREMVRKSPFMPERPSPQRVTMCGANTGTGTSCRYEGEERWREAT